MIIEKKKLKNGFELPLFGFGTWSMGGRDKKDPLNDDKADIAAIRTAIEIGITHIDTAAWYAEGHCEEIVGDAIKNYDRTEIILTTKVPPMELHYKDIICSAKKSLKRLGTDYIDIYVIHNPNPYIDIRESMEAFDYLLDKKLIKYIGLSNFNVKQFDEAQNSTDNPIVCNHLHYNLKHRGPLSDGSIEYAQKNDVLIVAWRPTQKGFFGLNDIEILNKLSEKYEKTPIQLAINWLISQKNVVTISKSRNIKHLKENLGAIGWEMEKSDIALLQNNFPDTVNTVENITLAKLIQPE
ncbi:MAG: aldo/keto reductase [Actinomycetota bacterium]|nr:aldo/keto reductase [Actinomycetota bacterium]